MSHKPKVSKKSQYASQDREGNRQFITILVVATLALMALLYYLFAQQ